MTTMTATSRRHFFAQLSSLGIVMTRPFSLLVQNALPSRVIPATGEAVPIVGLGSTKPVLQIPTAGTEPILGVLRALVRLGGRVVDTAPRTEEIDAEFGRVLSAPELRDKLFLATKINATGKQAGIDQMEQTQRLFGRRSVDVIEIESLTDLDTHWPSLREWKETGRARCIGGTIANNAGHDRLAAFIRRDSPDIVQVNYSVTETRAEEGLLPLAHERGVAVMTNRPFMNGSYFRLVEGRDLPEWAKEFDCTSWAQFSLKYILGNPAVTCVLTETTNPQHMEENIRAGLGSLPDEPTRRRMRQLVQSF